MPQQESSYSPGSNEPFHEKLREKLNEHLILALPIALVNGLVVWIMSRYFSQPWQILYFAIPLAVVAYFAWRRIFGLPGAQIGKTFLLLFSAYVLIFSLAAGTELLNWKRSLEGYDYALPRNFLSLNWMGDWRYWFVSKTEPKTDFVVVFMPPGECLDVGRAHVLKLIKLALESGVKGIAFDFHFKDNATVPEVDKQLCEEIKAAKIPILVGHGFQRQSGEITFQGLAPSLKDCVPESRQGHTVAYAEFDNMIRLVPLHFRNISNRESLGLKITRELQKDVELPPNGLVQFIKPKTDYPEIQFDDLYRERARLKDRFLLVGERKATDTWPTPYGSTPGVIIHSYVVHSLRDNRFLRRVPWWSSFLIVFAACYLVVFFFAQRWSRKKIVFMMLVVSVVICLISIVAVAFWLMWLEVIYPLVAMWLFFVLLLILSKPLKPSKETPETAASPAPNDSSSEREAST